MINNLIPKTNEQVMLRDIALQKIQTIEPKTITEKYMWALINDNYVDLPLPVTTEQNLWYEVIQLVATAKKEGLSNSFQGNSKSFISDTGRGVLRNTVIDGRTLQNLRSKTNLLIPSNTHPNGFTIEVQNESTLKATCNTTGTYNAFTYGDVEINLFKPSTVYTVIFTDLGTKKVNGINIKNLTTGTTINQTVTKVSDGVFKITSTAVLPTPNKDEKYRIILERGNANYVVGDTIYTSGLVVLEGDHTNPPVNEIPFGNGIFSVGDKENRNVEIKSNGVNLFNSKDTGNFTLNTVDNTIAIGNPTSAKSYTFKVKKNSTYFVKGMEEVFSVVNSNVIRVLFTYDVPSLGTKYIRLDNLTVDMNPIKASNFGYITLTMLKDNSNWNDETWFNVTKNSIISENFEELYQPYQEDIQTEQLPISLKSLPNGICDLWKMEQGEIGQNVEKVVFNGTENWVLYTGEDFGEYVGFTYRLPGRKEKTIVLCDKLPTVDNVNPKYECIYGGMSVFVKVLRNKLSSIDGNGFKQWLSQNNLTVYYQLETPVIHQLPKHNIRTYDGGTHVYLPNTYLPSKFTTNYPLLGSSDFSFQYANTTCTLALKRLLKGYGDLSEPRTTKQILLNYIAENIVIRRQQTKPNL